MTILVSLCCLALGWPAAPPAQMSEPLEVMLVKSGGEVVVKHEGRPTTVRLLGIDTPKTGVESPLMDRQSQTNHLRSLIAVGSKVRIAFAGRTDAENKGPVLGQVYRQKDGLWLNLAMVEDGFAVASKDAPPADYPMILAAEGRAREARRGMWATDFKANAPQPARFERASKHRPSRNKSAARFIETPPGGGVPALGMGLVPASASSLPFTPNPPAYQDPVWQSNYGLGYGSSPLLGMYPAFMFNPGIGQPFFGAGMTARTAGTTSPPQARDLNMQAIQQMHQMRQQAAPAAGPNRR